MTRLTEVRHRMLENVFQGKDLYDGFEGSQLGGAIRSAHLWREAYKFIKVSPGDCTLVLTELGKQALKT